MALYLGLDTGTSGTKAVLIDESGRLLASDLQEYGLSTPRPQWAEQHPDTDWWEAAVKAIQGVLAKAGKSGAEVAGVGLTGQMHGSVFLDKSLKVLRPALLWCDSRTGAECAEITEALGGAEGCFEILGQPVFTSFTAPKIVWLRKNEPAVYEKVAQVLLPKDYIRFKLTGELAAEVSDASGTSLFDVRKRTWSKEALAKLGIPSEWLPRVVESPEQTGVISAEAAALTGLKAGTPVVGGGGDQAAGAVGCGVVSTGQVVSSLGTSGVVFAHSDTAAIDPQMRVQTFCHAVPGTWGQMGCVISAGGSLRWYRDTFAAGTSYNDITAGAATAPAGCEGLLYLPYLAGERNPYFDPDARGVFFGATLRSTKGAVLEGVSYAFKDLFTLFAEMGVPVSEIRASGGGAKSPFWLQLMADVIEKKHVLLTIDEGPALGAALLAAVGTGAYASVPEACAATVSTRPGAEPDATQSAVYNRYYPTYRALYPALQESFAQVARLPL
ncbi:xylulokinase [Armatimonas rosea]|uniref:Xylulose kinase n=1 Tax=Armatimonas rosea TaxID=685828 RepID=A0A7W9SQX5_ARMRO|nr:xylulokinase [Armatimonas rosea]MBB6050574.1 xylulokinase [Armatimonas rosea]